MAGAGGAAAEQVAPGGTHACTQLRRLLDTHPLRSRQCELGRFLAQLLDRLSRPLAELFRSDVGVRLRLTCGRGCSERLPALTELKIPFVAAEQTVTLRPLASPVGK